MNNNGNHDDLGFFLFVVFIWVISSIATLALGFSISEVRTRKEAVRNGAAEWVASEHGSPEFKWKVKNEQK